MKSLIVGIDPDLSNMSAAIMDPTGAVYVIFDRVEDPKGCKGTTALKLARATETIRKIVNVVVEWTVRPEAIVLYLEDQSTAHAKREQKINIQDLVTLSHISGIWSGMFSALLWLPHSNIHLITASIWKQQQTKWINQRRTLDSLKISYVKMGGKKPYPAPVSIDDLKGMLNYSLTTPNPGDFLDINDSLGIMLYGWKQEMKHETTTARSGAPLKHI